MNHVCTLYKLVTTPIDDKSYTHHYEIIREIPYVNAWHRKFHEIMYEGIIKA